MAEGFESRSQGIHNMTENLQNPQLFDDEQLQFTKMGDVPSSFK